MKNTDHLQGKAVYAPDLPAIHNFDGGWDLAHPPVSHCWQAPAGRSLGLPIFWRIFSHGCARRGAGQPCPDFCPSGLGADPEHPGAGRGGRRDGPAGLS